MSADPGGTRRLRTAVAATVCLALLTTGGGLAWLADAPPVLLDLPMPSLLLAALLVPAYAFALRVSIDFEVRGNAHCVTPTQLPLALGVLLVLPAAHVAAALLAAVTVAVVRKQHWLKALYNSGVAVLEVGVVEYAMALAPAAGDGRPSPAFWLWFALGLMVAGSLGSVSLSAVWWLLQVPLTARQALEPLALNLATDAIAVGFVIVTISAALVEPATLALVLALTALATLAYRKHRRLVAQQGTTHRLYDFVRDLSPVDAEADGVHPVLEAARLLLHAQRLELLTRLRSGAWQVLVDTEGAPGHRQAAAAPSDPRRGLPAAVTHRDLDCLSTPLFGSQGFVGLLTMRGRLGDTRDFDGEDVQLLEAVGSELARALERGLLLTDLQRTATTDALTGLPNLTETARLVDEQLATGTGRVVVAALTVESFREVNDTLGHEIGDALLLETASRLRRSHPEALIGRLGGGRFAVALPDAGDDTNAHMVGLGLRALVEGEARVGQVGTHIRLSVGVAQAPADGTDAATLLRRAETAMSSARQAHGGPVAWAPAYEVRGQRRLAVVTALREAVATGAIGLAYQPKIDVATGQVTGVEALARWTHPALGHVSPEEFIPLAETSGAIGPLTSTVLRQAATACRGWQRRAAGVGVSINVSAQTVLDPAFVAEVAAVLTATGLEPQLLTLELTEGVVVGDPELACERLGELRALGARISVDDFGTGYSSLTYLKGLPVDEVKIDKGFVAGLGVDAADTAVVRAVVDIAHTLGVTVVAEGVELAEQFEQLRVLGVDQSQGFLHARPMPNQTVATWLRQRTAPASR